MMTRLRENPPSTLCGISVEQIHDYKMSETLHLSSGKKNRISLPVSNVIQLVLRDGSIITARPSGTEPKIKFYFSVKGVLNVKEDYEIVNRKMEEKLEKIILELGV